MKKRNDFIETYKQLENAIMSSNLSANTLYEYEDTLKDEVKAKKLQLIRIIRNFLQHQDNSDGFIAPTPAMVQLMRDEIDFIEKQRKKAKDILKRVSPITPSISVKEAADKLKRNKVIPVVEDGNLIGLMTKETVFKLFVGGAKRNEKLEKYISFLSPLFTAVRPDAPADKVKVPSIVTRDGTRNGKYVGLIL